MTAAPKLLRVACWNVHRCVGLDGRCDPERIAEVVAELDADVVALQEIETEESDGDGIVQLARVAETVGVDRIAGAAVEGRRAGFGNALLVRHPVREVRRIDLSITGREPRGALAARLGLGGEEIRVVSTHFGLRPGERRLQAERLLEALEPGPESLLVVVGDFNEWLPRAEPLRRLWARFGRPAAPRTFPSWRPVFALDRAFAHPAERLCGVEVHRSPLARVASDHLPIVATIAVPPGPAC